MTAAQLLIAYHRRSSMYGFIAIGKNGFVAIGKDHQPACGSCGLVGPD